MAPPAFASFPLIGTVTSTRSTAATTTFRCSAQPSNSNANANANSNVDRRSVLRTGAALFALQVLPTLPAHAARRPGTMSGDYKSDASKMLEDMKLATDLGRGAEGAVETVTRTRTEMNDFVALYRRNDKVAGSTSFNTLYTAINTLSGHYASYGNSYPVPEKRKKRLNQQYTEIERALNRGR